MGATVTGVRILVGRLVVAGDLRAPAGEQVIVGPERLGDGPAQEHQRAAHDPHVPAPRGEEFRQRIGVAVHEVGEREIIGGGADLVLQADDSGIVAALRAHHRDLEGAGFAAAADALDGEPAARRADQEAAAEEGGAGDADRAAAGGHVHDLDLGGVVLEAHLASPRHLEARVLAQLAPLGDDTERRRGDDEVEQRPQPDHQHDAVDAGLEGVAPSRRHDAGKQDDEGDQERPGERREMIGVERDALGGDVEGRLLRRGDHRGDRLDEIDALHVLIELGHPRPAHVAVEMIVHHRVDDDVGRHIGDQFLDRRDEQLDVEEDVQERREHEDQARQREEPVGHTGEIGDPLDRLEAALEQRALHQEELEHALAPARALADEGLEGLGLQARGERLVDIDAGPAGAVQLERRLAVLGDGEAGEAAGLV